MTNPSAKLLRFRYHPLIGKLVLAIAMAVVFSSRAQDVVGIYREVFTGIQNTTVASLTNAPSFPDGATSSNILSDLFETPVDVADYYGQRLRAILVAPYTGNYTFFICSDDQSYLYLSPTDNPASKQLIAAEPQWNSSRDWGSTTRRTGATDIFPAMDPANPANRSDAAFGTIYLTAGQRCYIEALHKEGGGGDNLSVAWYRPDGGGGTVFEGPIPASNFRAYGVPFPSPPVITQQPVDVTVVERESAQFQVTASSLASLNYQWQLEGGDISGATDSTYQIPIVALSQNNQHYRCVVYNGLGTNVTSMATLHVSVDSVKPTVVRVMNEGFNKILVVFSEPVESSSALYGLNYWLKVKETLEPVVLLGSPEFVDSDHRVVSYATASMSANIEYLLIVSNVRDTAATPNVILPDTLATFIASDYTPWNIGDLSQSGTATQVTGGYDLTVASSGIAGAADQMLFNYQLRTGDFDVSVQVPAIANSDAWALGGLMARETLSTNSLFAGVFATPSISGVQMRSRSSTGGDVTSSSSLPVNDPYTWLRLKRAGDVFTGYVSYDGATWYQVSTVTITAPATMYLGMAATSNNSMLGTVAQFRNIGTVAGGTISSVAPQFEPVGPSSRRTGLIISEIMYHPAARTDGRVLEFLELMNTTPFPQDISGYRLSGTIDFTFADSTTLAPGQYIVIAANPADLSAIYGINGVYGPYSGSLDSGSRQVRLRNNLGAVLLDVSYSNKSPWPVAADGAGHSLVLRKPSYGENSAQAWTASDRFGGSPGAQDGQRFDALKNVVINEFLAHTDLPDVDYIELYNHSNAPIDLSGTVLTDNASTNKFVIPSGTTIAARGFLSWNENQLGFALSAAGERIYFIDPAGQRVVDAVRFEGQENGVSTGRVPDGANAFYRLTAKTPGAANGTRRLESVVINEIMYHPISEDDDDAYVELYNRSSSAVDVSGWEFVDGINYTMPANTLIAANGYLVVARNAARLMTNYPNLNSGNTVGDYSGNLSHGGEHIELAMPDTVVSTNSTGISITNTIHITVAEVNYSDGGRWGQWADGGGSSLELIDPNADPRLAGNWADSDESNKAGWTVIEHTNVLDNGILNSSFPDIDRLQMMLLGAGECLVDDVEVIDANGNELLTNGGFDIGLTDWTPQGTHDHSYLETSGGYASPACLHVMASGRGDTGANRIFAPLIAPLTPGTTATLRARVRWMRGHPEFLLRTRGGHIEAYGPLNVPTNLGTPGAANSRRISNAGPAIYEVAHSPVLPAANQSIVVTARFHDRDGINGPQLVYRLDPATTPNYVAMRDDGQAGDAVSGDGIYSATIPGQAAGQLVAFYVACGDPLGALSLFPADAPTHECLVRFGEPTPYGSFPAYRVWITAATEQTWINRERNSNEPLDATFVYGNTRAVYNVGTLYSGSPWHTPGYNGPLGNQCDYVVVFPADDQFLGTTDFVLATVGNLGNDNTAQREQMAYWMMDKMGVYNNYRRYFHMFLNGQERGMIFEDAQQPSGDLVDEWFPGKTGGDLHKVEDWFEFDDSGDNHLINVDATLQDFTTTGGEKKLARYRWNWRKRAVKDSANEYADLFRLVDAINAPTSDDLVQELPAVMDVEQWLRVFTVEHIVGNWDSYGYNRGKNMYAYKPPGDRWQLLPWDIDFVLGSGSDGPTTSMFNTVAPMISRLYNHPAFQRLYWQSMIDAVNGPLAPGTANPYFDAKYAGMIANGLSVADGTETELFIAQRRDYLQQQIAAADAGFAITSNGGADFSITTNTLSLQGTAPLEMHTLEVNGVAYPIYWTAPTAWTVNISLKPGANAINFVGRDGQGNALAGASGSINVNYTGTADPLIGSVVINEIMYNPAVANSGYVELYNRSTGTSFDLSGLQLNGVDLTLPGGTVIAPGGYLVFAKNKTVFAETYGLTIPVAAEFNGSLDNGGETISLIQPGATPAEDVVIDAVRYDNNLPWASAADGTGASLQLRDSSRDNNRVGNWAAVAPGGAQSPATPGAVNSTLLSLPAFPNVWINEIQPINITGPVDPSNQHDPWLELYNGGGTVVDLSGLYLSDNYSNLTMWAFPSGASINPGQWLVVWLDGDTVQNKLGDYHTSFRINATAGGVAMTRSVGGTPVVLDFMDYQNVVADRSIGLYPDGAQYGNASFYFATPGAANTTSFPLVNVLINEWMADNTYTLGNPIDGKFDDWFELYNAGSSAVNLSGFYLTDTTADPTQWQVPLGTSIPAKGYLLVWADGRTGDLTTSPLHAGFKLSKSGEMIALYAPNLSLVDSVMFGAQVSDVSQGRFTDGAVAPYPFLTTPTPGSANIYNPPAILPQSVVRDGNGWTTVSWEAESGRYYDVLYKNDLNDPTWTLLGQFQATSNSRTILDQTSGGVPERFYLIQLLP